ncbi:pentaheme c-type cytochrome TorC [Photobacterium angustum]|uniref:Cytochrome c-type protein n=1 Tax=Photobacterium angustum TaxID=661 RepID=A0A855SCZ8_PHOAN|nr:pentaheme c-type cytochrome TorC [Photobacterium angustum]KJF80022.1 trimethylamine N-oxide reductase cytochrome c-type subunit [Photobacterium damselae subsp. damselae]KJG01532.1 trimethylamine N-oxide reductase cytochrome c-type subunit [Photobacterium angustum]KJG15506.1 trimethylamine N-oxide reductase cytochrome c-type subunit [Photobacterium angustum]KJG20689.1 trimethylamine N-oxide reductase cytochrome c-type subunit [Photobacterium angustum]KJG27599.1 trimethylamine N-oxide reducta
MKRLWQMLTKPSSKYSILALVFVGIVITLVGIFAVHKGFEHASTNEFCIGCHTMQQNFDEYKESVHFKNASGVRADCVDCHQPKDLVGMVQTKLMASKDVYNQFITKKIDTPEKFEEHRLELAQMVWDRMKKQNSSTCKSCHNYSAMDHAKQSPEAAAAMTDAAAKDMNCIECHKGIAHELPNMAGGFQKDYQNLQAEATSQGATADKLYSLGEKDMFATDDANGKSEGKLLPASEVTVLERKGDMLKVEVNGWLEKAGKGRVMTEYMGKRVFKATIRGDIKANEKIVKEETDPTTDIVWQNVTVQAWITKADMIDSIQPIWNYAEEMYGSTCNACHAAPAPGHFTANGWIASLKAMSAYYRLSKTEERTLLKYLQNHGSDTGGAGAH